jgi:hypothetical protein
MKIIALGFLRGVLKGFGGCAFAFGILAILPIPALTAPLDKNACAKLAKDMQNMKALDVDKLMEKGPVWAISHLSPADLSLVRQYIDLDEQMKFRCSAPGSLVHLKHLDEEEEETKPPAESADGDAEKQGESNKAGSEPSAQPKQKNAKAPKKPKPPAQASSGDAH